MGITKQSVEEISSAAPPIKGMKTMPIYCDNPAIMGAWFDFLVYTAKQRCAKAQFKIDTGFCLDSVVSSSGLAQMIDEATGYQEGVIVAWADWVTTTYWGEAG